MGPYPASIFSVGAVGEVGWSLVLSGLGVGLDPTRVHFPPWAGFSSQEFVSEWWLDG